MEYIIYNTIASEAGHINDNRDCILMYYAAISMIVVYLDEKRRLLAQA